VSVDPYLRPRQADPSAVGQVQQSLALCRVVESKLAALKPGDFVRSNTGWVDRAVAAGHTLVKVETSNHIPLEEHLGALGMVGLTAYWGIHKVFHHIKSTDVAFVTGAAGAVGQYVCQALKKHGCFVVGVAGSDAKCSLLKNKLGCDVAINYKTAKITTESLAALLPNKVIDLFWDNVGGETFDAAVQLMNQHGRVAVCGQIAHYDELATTGGKNIELAPRFVHTFIYKRARLEGILQSDASDEIKEKHQREWSAWLEGKHGHRLHSEFTIIDGFESIPLAMMEMMQGGNTGKMLVRCAKIA